MTAVLWTCVPNLDDMAFLDLSAFAEATSKAIGEPQRLAFAESLFPASVSPDEALGVLHALHTYASNCMVAMRHRMKGEIDQALRFESRCEMIYQGLPAYARW